MRGRSEGPETKVSASILSQIFSYLASRRIDANALLSSLGLDPAELRMPDARVPIGLYQKIEDEAARVAADPCFGLHVGEFTEAGSWSILGYMMMNCRNLAEAFEKSAKYCRIIGDIVESRPSIGKGKIEVALSTPHSAPGLSRHCLEAAVSGTVTMMRRLTGMEISPLEVRFSFPEPESRREYDRVLRCPLRFGQNQTALILDPVIGSAPVIYSNPGLLERMELYAREFLTGLVEGEETTRAVTRIIFVRMADGSLSLRSVARELNMSARTLQAKLAAEGRGFVELLVAARRGLAEKYLRESYSTEEISCLLGFSEASVFRRAFKKWSDMTPGEYRALPLSSR